MLVPGLDHRFPIVNNAGNIVQELFQITNEKSKITMDDDVDIYGDLPSFDVNECGKCKETSKELNEKNAELKAESSVWKNKYEAFEEEKKTILTNTSSLMKTARAEIARKDKIILELRRELEDLKFKRGIWSRAKTKRPVPNDLRKQLPAKQNVEAFPTKIIPTIPVSKKPVGKTFSDQDDEEPEQKWEPDRQNVTLYGERLRRKIQLEEEADRARRREAESSALVAQPTSTENPEALVNTKRHNEVRKTTGRKVADDKPPPADMSEEEEGQLVEENCQQRNGSVEGKSVENEIKSVRNSERVDKQEKRKEMVGHVVKSEYRSDDLYENVSEEDYEGGELVDDHRDDKPPNFQDNRHRKADVDNYNASFNRGLHYSRTTETRYDKRSRPPRDSSVHSDHDRRSRRYQKSQRSRLEHEQRSKSDYRSHSKTPERRVNDDKKYERRRDEMRKHHRDKYEKRKEDHRDKYNSRDHSNKDNYDYRDSHQPRIEAKIDDRGGCDNSRNYDSDYRRGGKSRSPEEKLRSRSNAVGVLEKRRGLKRLRSRERHVRLENNVESDNERDVKKRGSKDRKIDAYERNAVEKPQKSESARENSVEEPEVPARHQKRKRTTSAHETERDLIDGNKVAAETLKNLLDQVEARDKCILMLENEEIPLSPLTKPKNHPAGSHSFREEKIENIEKFIQDYQYDEAHWSVLGNDATSEQNDENNVANSTSGIVDTLSMDMEDIVVDKESHNKISENSKCSVDIKNSVLEHKTKKDSVCNELEGFAIDEKSNETINVTGKTPSGEKPAHVHDDGKSRDGSTCENLENIDGDKKSKNLAAEVNSKHITIDRKLNDAVADNKFEKTSARKTSTDVTVRMNFEDAVADKNSENLSTDKKKDKFDERKEEVSIGKKKEEIHIDKKEEVSIDKNEEVTVEKKKEKVSTDKKKDKVSIDKKKDKVSIDKKKEEVVIDKKMEEVAIEKTMEEDTHAKKMENVAIKKKTEKVAIVKKNEKMPIDKKKEIVATHEKKEEVVFDKKAESENIQEQLDDVVIGEKSGKVGNSNLGDLPTDTNSSNFVIDKRVVGDINSSDAPSYPIPSSEDICLDKKFEKTIENISTDVATDKKREDNSAHEKSKDAAIIDQGSENIQIHMDSENSVIGQRSENATIDEKLQNVNATIKLSGETIDHEREVVSSDRESDNLFRVEKPEDSVLVKKTEDPVDDDKTKHSPINKKCEASFTNSATGITNEKLQTPEIEENPERQILEVLPPLPPSPGLPPLSPSPPPEESDISISPKSQHIKQQDMEKPQVDKALSRQLKNRPRIPCQPIVSLYSRKRRGLVLTDSAASHTVVKSGKENTASESPREKSKSPPISRLEPKLVLNLVKVKHISKSSKIQSENPTDGPTVAKSVTESVSANAVETWNICQSKCVDANNSENATFDASKPEINAITNGRTSHDDENAKDERLSDSLDRKKNNLVRNEVKDTAKKSEETQPEVHPKVDSQSINTQRTSTSRSSTSSKSSERGKRSVLKTIASTVPTNDSGSSNRKRPLSREKENQSKIAKPVHVMVIRRRRPVQLEDSSTVTTLVSSEHEVINKDNNGISGRRDAPGRKRHSVET